MLRNTRAGKPDNIVSPYSNRTFLRLEQYLSSITSYYCQLPFYLIRRPVFVPKSVVAVLFLFQVMSGGEAKFYTCTATHTTMDSNMT